MSAAKSRLAGMARWTPAKRDVLDAVADEFLHNYGKGRTLLAVDGGEDECTRAFADDLAERLGRGSHAVFRASMRDFHRPQSPTRSDPPRGDRHAGGADSAEARYRDSYDYDLFRRVLVQPFRMGGSTGFVTAAFDVDRDIPIEMDWKTGPRDATLLVDGPFLSRPELRGTWNYSIWLETQDAVGPEQDAARTLYAAESKPRATAAAIMDNSDPEHPRRVFADSC